VQPNTFAAAVRGFFRAAKMFAAFGAGTGAQPLGSDSFARSSRTGNNEVIISMGSKTVKLLKRQQKNRPFGRKKKKPR
jgi:hypothetical protein